MGCCDGPGVVCVVPGSPTEQRVDCFEISEHVSQQWTQHLGPGTPSEVDQWLGGFAGDARHAGDHEFACERASVTWHVGFALESDFSGGGGAELSASLLADVQFDQEASNW